MATEVLVALITAAVSLMITLFGYFTTNKRMKELETFKAELATEQGEQEARRDYIYEARKRLYNECEPLLFQFTELSENGIHRIQSLARSAKSGDIAPGGGWLSGGGYYMNSTIYTLVVPLTIYKLMQRLLTLVDLSLDPHIEAQYTLAKALYISFTDDFDFARTDPPIRYNPNAAQWKTLRQTDPVSHWRQGVPVGRLDQAAECLLVKDDEKLRIMSFGEFEAKIYDQQSTVYEDFKILVDIFTDFHPKTRPILWRMLITQAHLYRAVRQTSKNKTFQEVSGKENNNRLWQSIPKSERIRFDWGQTDAEIKTALEDTFDVAERYLSTRLPGRQLKF